MNDHWAEEFYSIFERGLEGYTRPVDWQERAERLLTKQRKEVKHQSDGRAVLPKENYSG